MLASSRLSCRSALLTAVLMVLALLAFTAPASNAAGATAVWTGAESSDWGDARNWENGTPAAGDDLVFPVDGVRKQTSNSQVGVTYNSVTIHGSGYEIAGEDLKLSGGVTTTYTSGTSTIGVGLNSGTGLVSVASGGTLDLGGALSGPPSMTTNGGGIIKLSADSNPYTGPVIVGDGTLQVDGKIFSPIQLAGGTLAGSGTLNGAGITATSASTISPGPKDGPGTLTYAASSTLTLPSSTTLHVDIDGPTVGTDYDRLALTNGSALFNPNGATLDVDLGYVPAVNTSFQIVSQTFGSPITGRFNGISQFGSFTSGPVTFSVGYFNSGIILTVVAVQRQTATWDGGGATSSWSEAANWDKDTAPVAGNNLVFPAGVSKLSAVNDYTTGTTFGSVTIASPGYALSGTQFVATSGLRAPFGTGTSTIANSLKLSGSGAVTVDDGGTLTLSGPLTGTDGITKAGAGRVLLAAPNTYTGVTTVSAGTLGIQNSSALGSSVAGNGTAVSSGATLEVRGTINTSEPIRVVGAGVGDVGALNNATGNNVVQNVTLTGDASIGAANNTFLLIASTLAQSGGTAALTKTGAGTLDVLATASYTGGTTVDAGSLVAEGTISGQVLARAGTTVAGAGGNLGDVSSVGGTVTAGFASSPFISKARSLALDSSSSFVAQLKGRAAGNGSTGHSRLDVAQGAALNGATLVATVSGYDPEVGDTLTILTAASGVSGTFDNLPEGAYVSAGNGHTFRISYQGGGGHDVTLTSVAGSSTTLTTSPNPVGPGDEVTVKAIVTPGTATGTVTFKSGATVLGSRALSDGVAVLKTSSLAIRSHTITATYSGDAATAPSTSLGVTQDVVDSPPDTTIATGPAAGSTGNTPHGSFTFTSPDTDVVGFECSLDGADFAACSSPLAYTGLSGGEHTFAVRAVDDDGNVDPTPATRTWTVAGAFAATGSFVISGTPKVGETLSLSSVVSTTPAATGGAGQWFRGPNPIPGATGTSYRLTNEDVSSVITYSRTFTRDNYTALVAGARATAKITGGVIELAAPTISGTPVVDGTLTATAGTVTPGTATTVLSWNVGGIATGVTGDTYQVTVDDAGKTITVVAEATQDDFDTITKTSAATEPVAEATFSTSPTATISGVLKVGQTLTVTEGAPVPTADSYTYQWFAGGSEIGGATERTFTLQPAQKGKTISARVTALRAGYVPARNSSASSSAVATNLAPGLTLSGSSPRVRLGQKATLKWTTTDATTVVASGSWSGSKGTSGSEIVKPASTGTRVYVLRATNDSGTTTAQIALQVGLPAVKVSLKARGTVKAGRKLTVTAKGLAAGESYTVYVSGKRVASGKVPKSGTLARSVRVPSATKAGKRVVRVTGSLSDRTGSRTVKVTKPSVTKVTLRSSTVRASDNQRVTVRGLAASEKVKVTYKGKRVSPKSARANSKGVYTLTFDVGVSWGTHTVKVAGSHSRRATSKSFSVVTRCPQGGYYCR